jgi:HEPN domain-containing protein
MVNKKIVESYIKRSEIRKSLLQNYLDLKDYADVIREAQEIIELLQKAILIYLGITPPKWHDVIDIIIENIEKIPENLRDDFIKIKEKCKYLRTQREIAFYGEMDFIPENYYKKKDALDAIKTVEKLFSLAKKIIKQ